jgi:hypothetical protein
MTIEKLPAIAALIASILASTLAGEGLADQLPRLAQYAVPNVPGGLPGMAAPPPAHAPALPTPALSAPNLPAPSLSAPNLPAPSLSAPTLRAPEAAPSVAVPPPPPAAPAPEAHGAEVCDCHAEVDVPVYANGQIVGWRRERHPTGRSPQCCPK